MNLPIKKISLIFFLIIKKYFLYIYFGLNLPNILGYNLYMHNIIQEISSCHSLNIVYLNYIN